MDVYSEEIKISIYILFAVSLYFINDPFIHIYLSIAAFFVLIFHPVKRIRSGALPIFIFLFVTFAGNLFFQNGKILYSVAGIDITEKGVSMAIVRTSRVFLLIAGAKLLIISSSSEGVIKAMGNLMKPFAKIGIPVEKLTELTLLSMKVLPKLKETIKTLYKEKLSEGEVRGFFGRTNLLVSLIVPLFLQTVTSPEKIFKEIIDGNK